MTQAIPLPDQIFAAIKDSAPSKVVELINDYAREVTIVGIILSDNYMKELYDYQGTGYIAAIDTLHDWAKEFVKLYAHVEEWEEFCDTQTVYENIMCWDDFVIAFGAAKMKGL